MLMSMCSPCSRVAREPRHHRSPHRHTGSGRARGHSGERAGHRPPDPASCVAAHPYRTRARHSSDVSLGLASSLLAHTVLRSTVLYCMVLLVSVQRAAHRSPRVRRRLLHCAPLHDGHGGRLLHGLLGRGGRPSCRRRLGRVLLLRREQPGHEGLGGGTLPLGPPLALGGPGWGRAALRPILRAGAQVDGPQAVRRHAGVRPRRLRVQPAEDGRDLSRAHTHRAVA